MSATTIPWLLVYFICLTIAVIAQDSNTENDTSVVIATAIATVDNPNIVVTTNIIVDDGGTTYTTSGGTELSAFQSPYSYSHSIFSTSSPPAVVTSSTSSATQPPTKSGSTSSPSIINPSSSLITHESTQTSQSTPIPTPSASSISFVSSSAASSASSASSSAPSNEAITTVHTGSTSHATIAIAISAIFIPLIILSIGVLLWRRRKAAKQRQQHEKNLIPAWGPPYGGGMEPRGWPKDSVAHSTPQEKHHKSTSSTILSGSTLVPPDVTSKQFESKNRVNTVWPRWNSNSVNLGRPHVLAPIVSSSPLTGNGGLHDSRESSAVHDQAEQPINLHSIQEEVPVIPARSPFRPHFGNPQTPSTRPPRPDSAYLPQMELMDDFQYSSYDSSATGSVSDHSLPIVKPDPSYDSTRGRYIEAALEHNMPLENLSRTPMQVQKDMAHIRDSSLSPEPLRIIKTESAMATRNEQPETPYSLRPGASSGPVRANTPSIKSSGRISFEPGDHNTASSDAGMFEFMSVSNTAAEQVPHRMKNWVGSLKSLEGRLSARTSIASTSEQNSLRDSTSTQGYEGFLRTSAEIARRKKAEEMAARNAENYPQSTDYQDYVRSEEAKYGKPVHGESSSIGQAGRLDFQGRT
ncbi:hypothetical protein B7494_g5399 [Chlorociboria aeruginascens]|nr:hypothetical protein B7494_g5399 [Chlorociboria aeruginascens]